MKTLIHFETHNVRTGESDKRTIEADQYLTQQEAKQLILDEYGQWIKDQRVFVTYPKKKFDILEYMNGDDGPICA